MTTTTNNTTPTDDLDFRAASRAAVANAASLDDLCTTLNALDAGCVERGYRVDEVIDTTSLPTFGGDAPADTTDIYSWDAENYLMPGYLVAGRGNSAWATTSRQGVEGE